VIATLKDGHLSVVVLACGWTILLGAYLLYVAYLSWRPISTLAINHVCFILSIGILLVFAGCLHIRTGSGGEEEGRVWSCVALLFATLAAYVFYRVSNSGFMRAVFPSAERDDQQKT
jgi:hypothetical protein